MVYLRRILKNQLCGRITEKMDVLDKAMDLMSIASLLLILLMDSQCFLLRNAAEVANMEVDVEISVALPVNDNAIIEIDNMSWAALYHFRLWSNMNFLEEDLGY